MVHVARIPMCSRAVNAEVVPSFCGMASKFSMRPERCLGDPSIQSSGPFRLPCFVCPQPLPDRSRFPIQAKANRWSKRRSMERALTNEELQAANFDARPKASDFALELAGRVACWMQWQSRYLCSGTPAFRMILLPS